MQRQNGCWINPLEEYGIGHGHCETAKKQEKPKKTDRH